ncbi:glycosyltransferase family 2 protein, partial [Candidatus Daviesbacteria bacterium]|nr:glycosyltransferase family 2 protein [Candidatus Daviesbacteria bacterium]
MIKKAKNFPKVSIIIPTLNRSKSLKITLASIYKMNYPRKKLEVILLD